VSQLPGGTVTFVFTDIEGSTRLLQELGDEAYGRASGDHRRIVRDTFGARGGTEIDTQGDAFFFSFPRARDAVAAAVDAQRALRDHEWPEGKAVLVQILLSETTRALLGNQLPEGVAVHDLGEQHLKDVQHEHIYELTVDGRASSPRPLKTQTPKSRQEDMATRFEDRITSYVERQLEAAFDEEGTPKVPAKLALGGAAIGFGVLLMFLVVLAGIALLIKTLFF